MVDYTQSLHDITKTGDTFQMNVGFVRGSHYAHSMVTGIDGYNSDLLIMDTATQKH